MTIERVADSTAVGVASPTVRAIAYLLTICTVSPLSWSAGTACFIPSMPTTDRDPNVGTIRNRSSLCAAVLKELTKQCGTPMPICDTKALGGLATEPASGWEIVPLYTVAGAESAEAFRLVRDLTRAKTYVPAVPDIGARQDKREQEIVDAIRNAQRSGWQPRLERAEVDLGGLGRKEVVYQLWVRSCATVPASFKEYRPTYKGQPILLLARAISESTKELDYPWQYNAGTDLMLAGGEVVLIQKRLYIFNWAHDTVRIYKPFENATWPNRLGESAVCQLQYKY